MKSKFNNEKYDLGIAQRFKTFRKKYISNNGYEAAKLLDMSQSTISRMEHGEYRINADTLKLLIKKFNLNRDWLIDNTGQPLMSDKESKSTIVDINDLKDKTDALLNEISMLNKSHGKLWSIVEQQGKAIDDLQKQLSKIK